MSAIINGSAYLKWRRRERQRNENESAEAEEGVEMKAA
jgi:hypothetical protein